MTKQELQIVLEHEYAAGLEDGRKMYEQQLLDAIAAGKPIELNGRAWYLQSDVERLRQIMNGN